MMRITTVLYLWVALAALGLTWDAMGQNAPAPAPSSSRTVIDYGQVQVAATPAVEGVFWHAMQLIRCAFWSLLGCHVLLAAWVLLDLRKRKEGSPIFVVLTLIAGFLAAVVYALVRIGDRKA